MTRVAVWGVALTVLAWGPPALAADLPVKAPPPVVVLDHWTGSYVGFNVGYGWGRADTTLTQTDVVTGTITETTLGGTIISVTPVGPITTVSSFSDRAKMDGWLGGGQIGYNRKFNNWLVGIEADIQGTGQSGGSRFCITAGCPAGSTVVSSDLHLRWFGTLRGRVGWVWDNSLLLYATGGLAVGRLDGDVAVGLSGAAAPLSVASIGQTRVGWVVGVGGERRVSERWSVKLEYLYMDLGSVGANAASSVTSLPLIFTVGDRRFIGVATTASNSAFSARFTDHILRVGVNYRL
jgi:outer membrane immunogenic protein